MNIKLVAIAKDEAAYLSEWVFHHLYFGFDEIDIYINFTSDESEKLLRKIGKQYPVNLHFVENLIPPDSLVNDKYLSERFLTYNKLQARAYSDAVARSLEMGKTTHIAFLDIDEFWTPVNFKKGIKNVLTDLGLPDVASFYWKNKVNEALFQRPFQSKIYFQENPHYKTIVKLSPDIMIMNTHRTLHKSCIDKFGDRYNEKQLELNSKQAFILHRFQRHEIEYLSMLGRGDPTSPYKFSLKFTRSGFHQPLNPSSLCFDESLINNYDKEYEDFVIENELTNFINTGRAFVFERKKIVVEYINEHLKICETIKKVLPDISLLDVTHDSYK